MSDDFQKKIEEALRDPKNLGELEGADAVGTAGSAACGDMIRLWIKFKEQAGKRVVDKATFQSFGCETAIAVASLATEMIRGKTAEEVLALSAEDLAPGLGPLPGAFIASEIGTAVCALVAPPSASAQPSTSAGKRNRMRTMALATRAVRPSPLNALRVRHRDVALPRTMLCVAHRRR